MLAVTGNEEYNNDGLMHGEQSVDNVNCNRVLKCMEQFKNHDNGTVAMFLYLAGNGPS